MQSPAKKKRKLLKGKRKVKQTADAAELSDSSQASSSKTKKSRAKKPNNEKRKQRFQENTGLVKVRAGTHLAKTL